MTLDPRPSDAELLRRLADRDAAVIKAAVREVYRQDVPSMSAITKRLAERASQPAWWDPRMNFTEQQYAGQMENERLWGHVRHWKYEPFSMRLAPSTYYRPDFLVEYELARVRLEIHEVKGFWRDDARAKFKIAAELYPMFVFRAVRRVEGVFHIIETLNA